MRRKIPGRLLLGFSLLAVLPLVLGIVAFRSARESEQASAEITRTNERIQRLEELEESLKDVEIAQNRYLLTGEQESLQVIQTAPELFRKQLANLEKLQPEPMWLELLRDLIPQKLDEVQKTVRLRQEEGLEKASEQLLAINRGEGAMANIREAVSNLHSRQVSKLREGTREQSQSFRQTMVAFGILLAFNIACLAAMAVFSAKEQNRIEALNQDLERRVALRTEALQRSNEDLQQFAYVASHDLREPMRMISSYTTLLQRRYRGKLDGDADTFVGYITQGVERMNLLITDLLEYSKAGEQPEEAIEVIDANSVLQAVLTNLKVTISESRATIRAAKLPRIEYDPMRLTQVFQNLIGNAIKYRGERPPLIEISANAGNGETIFSIKDNGIGIDPKYQDEIFGIFKRLHTKEYEGTGIGLAMVKKIVERQGGRIWVESQPGIGSTFYFSVPQRHPVQAAEAAAT